MPEEAINSEEPMPIDIGADEQDAEAEDEQTDETESTEEQTSESEEEESETDGSAESENYETEDAQLSVLPEPLRKQIQEERQMLGGVRDLISDLMSDDPNRKSNAIAYLNQEFNLSLQGQSVQQEATEDRPEWEALGISEEDYEYHKPAIDAAVKIVEKQYRSEIDSLKQRFAQMDQETKAQQYMDANYAKIADKVKADTGGYNISKSDLAQALKAFPTLDPVKAVKAFHVDKILRVQLSKSEKAKKGPAMIQSTGKGNSTKIGEEPYSVPVK